MEDEPETSSHTVSVSVPRVLWVMLVLAAAEFVFTTGGFWGTFFRAWTNSGHGRHSKAVLVRPPVGCRHSDDNTSSMPFGDAVVCVTKEGTLCAANNGSGSVMDLPVCGSKTHGKGQLLVVDSIQTANKSDPFVARLAMLDAMFSALRTSHEGGVPQKDVFPFVFSPSPLASRQLNGTLTGLLGFRRASPGQCFQRMLRISARTQPSPLFWRDLLATPRRATRWRRWRDGLRKRVCPQASERLSRLDGKKTLLWGPGWFPMCNRSELRVDEALDSIHTRASQRKLCSSTVYIAPAESDPLYAAFLLPRRSLVVEMTPDVGLDPLMSKTTPSFFQRVAQLMGHFFTVFPAPLTGTGKRSQHNCTKVLRDRVDALH